MPLCNKPKMRFKLLVVSSSVQWPWNHPQPMILCSGCSSMRTIHSSWAESRVQQSFHLLSTHCSSTSMLPPWNLDHCHTLVPSLSTLSDSFAPCFCICRCTLIWRTPEKWWLSWFTTLADSPLTCSSGQAWWYSSRSLQLLVLKLPLFNPSYNRTMNFWLSNGTPPLSFFPVWMKSCSVLLLTCMELPLKERWRTSH